MSETKVLIGWVRAVFACPIDGKKEHKVQYFLELEGHNDEFITLKFATAEQENNTPRNIRIALVVTDKGGYCQVEDTPKYFSYVDDYAAAEIPSKKHLALLVQVPLDAAEDVKAAAQLRGEKNARLMQEYYQHYSKFKWDVQVRAYAFPSNTSSLPPTWSGPGRGAFVKALTDFSPNYVMVWGGTNPGFCGHAQVGGNLSVTYANCGLSTMLHEWGHILGLSHAAELDQLGNFSEYGDGTSVMGSGNLVGLNSHNLTKLGLESNREIKVIEGSEQVLIAPIELHEHALFTGEYQTVVVRRTGQNDLYLSIRKGKGPLYPLRHNPQRAYIHESDDYGRSVLHTPNLEPGETKNVNGVVFEYLSYDAANESAIINVIIDRKPVKNAVVRPTKSFPDSITGTTPKPEYTGVWYNRLHQKQGYDIQIKNGLLLFFWYTFNERDDALRYYYGTTNLDEANLGFDLYTTENGTFKNPEKVTVNKKIGQARLYFFDETRAVLNFNTVETGRGSVEIFPLENSSQFARTGCFADPAKKASGFVNHIFHDGDTCVAFWYTYGKKKYQYSQYQTQRWYLCSGKRSKESANKYELEIFESVGGRQLFVKEAADKKVGTGTLEYINDNAIKVEYSFDADNGSGTEMAYRIF